VAAVVKAECQSQFSATLLLLPEALLPREVQAARELATEQELVQAEQVSARVLEL
jgi:hypothetical protein